MALPKGTPFKVEADHDGADTLSYRLYINSESVQEKPVAELVDGVITFEDADGLPKGSYDVIVAAVNADGEGRSEPVTLQITGEPAPPVNIRITRL
jgi:hypothetical protein